MTVDIVRLRTDRASRDGHDADFLPNRDATMDVSDLPVGRIEAYVDRAIGDGYREYSLERRGTKVRLTAVREPPVSRDETASNRFLSNVSNEPDPSEADRSIRSTRSGSEWTYAVLATESTPQ